MKFASVLIPVTALIVAVTGVSATPFRETNGERFARGLPPLPPQKRSGTPVYAAKRNSPSGSPSPCTTGYFQCCDTVGTSTNPTIASELSLEGIAAQPNVLYGTVCSTISPCSLTAVCCTDTSNPFISIGCTTVTT